MKGVARVASAIKAIPLAVVTIVFSRAFRPGNPAWNEDPDDDYFWVWRINNQPIR